MTLDDLFRFYGATSQEDLADRLGVSQGAISQWKAAGQVPIDRQLRVEMLTNGKLLADRKALFAKLAG